MNAYACPNGYICRLCRDTNSCNSGFGFCNFSFSIEMEKTFKEELSVFCVAITRAKKNVFLTVNKGLNQWNHTKQTSCLISLQGLKQVDYKWNDVIM